MAPKSLSLTPWCTYLVTINSLFLMVVVYMIEMTVTLHGKKDVTDIIKVDFELIKREIISVDLSYLPEPSKLESKGQRQK
jgi:hypothetical protein